MIKSLKYVMPYRSIHFRVPDYWIEDGATEDNSFSYSDPRATGGPLLIRRNDYNLETAEMDVFGGREFSGVGDTRSAAERFLETFERLKANFAGPDVLHRAMETLAPQEDGLPEARLFSYRKLELADGGDNVVWGWVRGRPMSEASFCVVSFVYRAPKGDENSDAIADVVGMLDREVRRATIHSLAEVERVAKDAVRRHLLDTAEAARAGGRPIDGGQG